MLTFIDKQKTLFGRLKKLRENATHSELLFKEKLDEWGVKYIFQKGFIKGDYYCIVDFYLPRPHRLCIEIDGGYHDSIKERDLRKDKYLRSRGFKVLRIKNENINKVEKEMILLH